MEPVSNGDWFKSFRPSLGLSAGENSNKTQLISSAFSAPLTSAFSLLLTFFALFSEAFCLSYSRCSALDICHELIYMSFFMSSFAFIWLFSCPFFSCRFSFLLLLSVVACRMCFFNFIFNDKHYIFWSCDQIFRVDWLRLLLLLLNQWKSHWLV